MLLSQIGNLSPTGMPQPGAGDPGVFRHGGNLFTVIVYPPVQQDVQVWKSTDGGVSWTQLDAANEPNALYDAQCLAWDGANTLTIALLPSPGASAPVILRNFDLAGETWGAPFGGAGAPSPDALFGLYRRSSGDLVLLVEDTTALPGVPSRLGAYVFSGGAWSSIVDLETNVEALPGWAGSGANIGSFNNVLPAVMDAADTLHIFFALTDPFTPGWTDRFFYQQFLSGGGLGSFFDFPGQGALPVDLLYFGLTPAVGNNTILMPVIRSLPGPIPGYVSVYVGTPLNAPVWTELAAPGVDAASYNVFDGTAPYPAAAFDGALWYVIFVQPTDPAYGANQVRVAQSANPLLGWTTSTVYDFLVDPTPPGFVFPGQAFSLPNWRIGSVLGRLAAFLPGFVDALFFLFAPLVPPLVPSCNNPPGGLLLQPYSHTFTASGGTPPYTFAISAGALPPGLSLVAATGVASGTPTTYGVFTFTVQVTDSAAVVATVACSITIQAYVAGVEVILRGVKRRPSTACEPISEVSEPPHVEKAV